MAKHYVYGSGMSGCLYDWGPNLASSVDEAVESVLWMFDDQLEDGEAEQLGVNLRESGLHYFENSQEAGAQYCEVQECTCKSPKDHDPEWEDESDETVE